MTERQPHKWHTDTDPGSCVLVDRVSGRIMCSDADPPIDRAIDVVHVRDCRAQRTVLAFDAKRWQEFLDGLKAGEFDTPR